VFAERTGGGYFLDFEWKRDELARYGLSIENVQDVLMSAVGGENVSIAIQGRERYPVNVRYARDFRTDLSRLERVLVTSMDGRTQVPVSQLAEIKLATGPAMLRDENGMLSGNVYVVRERLGIVLPLTLALVIVLLYLNTRSWAKTAIVLLAVPFSAIGAIWFLYLLDYNMSIGVWVGLIALLGVDAETGVFMLLYLDLAYEKAKKEGRLRNLRELQEAIHEGAVKRIRPKFMTVATTFIGLVPILWAIGAGADVMKRIAAPMIGGILTSFILELVVYPAIFEVWKWNTEVKKIA
jgi:Cu(I)/Ag(I) efflux system membrane protein CusA/SilA